MHCEISALWPWKGKIIGMFKRLWKYATFPKSSDEKIQDSAKTCKADLGMLQNPWNASLFGGTAEVLVEEWELASKPSSWLLWIIAWTLFILPNSTSCLPWLVFLISTISVYSNQICITCSEYCIFFFLEEQCFLRFHLCNCGEKGSP